MPLRSIPRKALSRAPMGTIAGENHPFYFYN